MAIVSYITFVEGVTKGLKWAQATWGSKWFGLQGVLANAIAEGNRQAFIAGLPGHPEQARDSLDACGYDRKLILYPGEDIDAWTERIRGAWDDYYYSGTDQTVLAQVDRWGSALFPLSWVNSTVTLVETGWATFDLNIPRSLTSWGNPVNYDDPGVIYDAGFIYDGDANASHLSLLRSTIKKYKPKRSWCRVVVYDTDPGDAFFTFEVK